MEAEIISQIDFLLRKKNGTQNLLDIDALIVVDSSNDSISKLKTAAQRLSTIDTFGETNLADIWAITFNKQVKKSIDRAKTLFSQKSQN